MIPLIVLFAARSVAATADQNPEPLPVAATVATDSGEASRTLSARLDRLEETVNLQQTIDQQQAASAPQVRAGADGYSIRSGDGESQIRFWGLIQEDGRFFHHDIQKPAVNSLLLRRVRPGADVTVGRVWTARVLPDFGGGTAVLQDAYLEWRLSPALGVRAGKFKPPIGYEQVQSDAVLPFIERGLVSALQPNRDVGLLVSGEAGRGLVAYGFGVFDGAVDGGASDADADDDKDAAGRVFVQPLRPFAVAWLDDLGVGVGGSWGHRAGSATAPALPSYRTAGQQTWFAFSGTTTGIAEGRWSRLVPQAAWFVDRFGLTGEYAEARQALIDPKSRNARLALRTVGWQTQAIVVVTGEHPGFKGTVPHAPLGQGGFGAVEVVGRVNELKVDSAAFGNVAGAAASAPASPTTSARSAQGWAVGLNWYPTGNARLSVDWERTRFTGGASATVGGRREEEQVLLARLQLAY